MALRARFPELVERITVPLGRGVARTGVSPNQLTTLGIVLTTAAAITVGAGRPFLGGWILLAGGLMDTFDGAVARARGASTPYGAFYDSVSDRLSDGIILAGILYHVQLSATLFVVTAVALVTAQVTSYVRAKAEAIDLDCSVGLLERAERAILLIVALVFHQWLLGPILWVLAVGGAITVVQRVHHVWCQIDRDVPDELIELVQGDRVWNRAFTAAARALYGEKNFDGSAAAAAARNGADEATQ